MAAYTDQQISDYVKQNAANPGLIAGAMQQYGVGFDQIKQAGNWSDSDVENYVSKAGDANLSAMYSAYKTGKQADAALPASTQPATGAASNETASTTPATVAPPAMLPTPAPSSQSVDYQGIINSAITQALSSAPKTAVAPTASQVTAPTVAAFTQEVDPGQTVEGIISRLVGNTDTPWIKRAQAIALEGMNNRGLLSSSLAQGAGTAAAIDAAGKVAEADANIYAQQRIANQNAVNSVNVSNADRQFGVSKANADATNAINLAGFSAANQRDNTVLSASLDAAMTPIKTAAQKDIMSYQSDIDLNKMANELTGDLTKMSVDQQNYLQRLTTGLNIDLKKMAVGQEFDLQKLAVANNYDIGKMRQSLENDIKLSEIRSSLDTESRKTLATFEDALSTSSQGRAQLTTATSRYATMSQAIRIDPNLSAADKAAAMDDLRNDWINDAQRIATIYGIKLPDDYLP